MDSLMKFATSLMKRGLIAHSTETVATIAVVAGVAAGGITYLATRPKKSTRRQSQGYA